jgi:hypothetical protein
MPRTTNTGPLSNEGTTTGRPQTRTTDRDRYWRSLPDDTRETWAFLSIGTVAENDNIELREWHLATGNPVQLVRHHSSTRYDGQPAAALYEALSEIRRDGVTLHTPTPETIRQLRTTLLKIGGDDVVTLRGMNHVAVLALLDEFFAAPAELPQPVDALRGRPRETSSDSIPTVCWEIRTVVKPLLPESALQGEPL